MLNVAAEMKIVRSHLLFPGLFFLFSLPVRAQPGPFPDPFNGDTLYSDVVKFTSFGIHRTGTPGDTATSEWLGNELRSYGYGVRYLDFAVTQFFPDRVSVQAGDKRLVAFPVWWVSAQPVSVQGVLADGRTLSAADEKNKIVLLRFNGGDHIEEADRKRINQLAAGGVRGIIIIRESITGEMVAANTSKDSVAWPLPVVIIASKDSSALQGRLGKEVGISISGQFAPVKARNVYGTIGTGNRYVVISTPISGWFTCGGERGPGIATWLALAKWAADAKLPYTFIFTANSGHELFGIGAHAFLDRAAPPAELTALWVHLGAGIATLNWNQTSTGLQKGGTVDSARIIVYTPSTVIPFQTAFKNISAIKREVNGEPVGELVYVAQRGYRNYAGAANAHQTYFHTPVDDAAMTSAPLLREIALAFKNFIAFDLEPAKTN